MPLYQGNDSDDSSASDIDLDEGQVVCLRIRVIYR